MSGAWGAGLATFSGDRVLEVFYPEPKLEDREAGFTELSADDAEAYGLSGAQRTDDLRGVRQAPVLTAIGDLGQPPDGTADAYLRLHLLSHRLVKPHERQPRRRLRRAAQRRLDERGPGRPGQPHAGAAQGPRERDAAAGLLASTSSRA